MLPAKMLKTYTELPAKNAQDLPELTTGLQSSRSDVRGLSCGVMVFVSLNWKELIDTGQFERN
jgi:hypothetical protein